MFSLALNAMSAAMFHTNQKVVFVYTLLAESSVEPDYFSLSLGAQESESRKTE